jgi:hypothetical protein
MGEVYLLLAGVVQTLDTRQVSVAGGHSLFIDEFVHLFLDD